ncbi:MAG: hypothetical protein SF182_25010 [Deltaproteobacteria bacterium]|nr:hypothetical protein [Deltaproteobacteria bacterium]
MARPGAGDFVWHPAAPAQYRRLPVWRRALHRLEWSAVGSGAYYLRAMWWGKIVRGAPHHVDPHTLYYHLPRAAAALRPVLGDAMRERPYRLRDYVRATRRCKLYDFERRAWRGYDAARGV